MKRKISFKVKKVTRRMVKEYQNALKSACPQWTRAYVRLQAKRHFFCTDLRRSILNVAWQSFKWPMLTQGWIQLAGDPRPNTAYAWASLSVAERMGAATKFFEETGQIPTYEEFGCYPSHVGDLKGSDKDPDGLKELKVTFDFEHFKQAQEKKDET